MTNWVNACTSREVLSGGQHRDVIGIAPRAVMLDGYWRAIADAWQDGDATYPDVVSQAPLAVRSAGDGRYRIYPVAGDLARYTEIARPYVKPAASWQPLALGNRTRQGNRLSWTGSNVDLTVTMAGHYVGWEMPLKGGYVPPSSQFAVPMALVGLTRSGARILADGVPVMLLRPPVVYDGANPLDTRPITWTFGSIGSQTGVLFTLPSLAGMARPVVDPTFSSQPAAAAGMDTLMVAGGLASNNYGTETFVAAGEGNDSAVGYIARTLIKFDLSTIPSSASISSAQLSHYATADKSSNARTLRVYRQLRAWVEAEATWNIYSTGNNWATAGGFGAADCEQTDIGSRAFTATETLNEFKIITLTPTTKAALDLGNGWLLKMDTESDDRYDFASSDALDPTTRPTLTLTYSLPGGGIGRGRVAVLSRGGW